MSTYPIRLAADNDVDAILALRTEAEEWLRQRGIRQWTDDYREYARDVLRTSVQDGACWVVEDNGQVIATITISQADTDFWDPEDDLDSAMYLGKAIVARSHAHQELGDAVMNWASWRADLAGKKWMRIDVRRDNERLHRYWLGQGWEYVRTVDPPRRRTESGTLFQRPAGSTTLTTTAVRESQSSASTVRGGLYAED